LVRSGGYDDILKAMAGEIDFDEDAIANANDKLQAFAKVLNIDIDIIKD
jgi:hypothetical protein